MDKGVEKKSEPKDSREVRRLKAKQELTLQTLVKSFMTRRSGLSDPNGGEADRLFGVHEEAWRVKCINFNKNRTPFKLRYEAFSEIIDNLIKEEAEKIKQAEEENRVKKLGLDFEHWFKRSNLCKTRPLTSLLYWFRAQGNREKIKQLWKHYFVIEILNERNTVK